MKIKLFLITPTRAIGGANGELGVPSSIFVRFCCNHLALISLEKA